MTYLVSRSNGKPIQPGVINAWGKKKEENIISIILKNILLKTRCIKKIKIHKYIYKDAFINKVRAAISNFISFYRIINSLTKKSLYHIFQNI